MLVAAVKEHVGDEPPGLLPPVRVVDEVGVDWPVSLAEAVPDAEVLGAQNAGGEFDALFKGVGMILFNKSLNFWVVHYCT